MTEEIVEQQALLGECSFCKSQVEKKKMTQHLKSCRQRLEATALEKPGITKTGKGSKKKEAEPVTFFHLLAEGRYNPQYWMHIEMSASDELADLDHFLRDIWVECCDHLSAFKIGEVNYSDERMDYYDFGPLTEEGNEVVVEAEEEEEEEGDVSMEEVLKGFPPEVIEILSPQFLAEFVKLQNADDAVKLLRAEIKMMPKEKELYARNHANKAEYQTQLEAYRRHYMLKQTLNLMIDMLEDRSMYQPLEKVLRVGQAFTYEYDFGSTTHLKLKVVAKREGVPGSKGDIVKVLARNLPPDIKCCVCGKPATKVVGGSYVEENGYCNKCARKSEESDYMLPVVNSPRVGVCGYTG